MLLIDKVIGHRGACAYAPENTMASFKKALSLGCRFIEFDVMCSADGEPFIIHDDTLKRTTDAEGFVGLVDAAYLSTLDAGSWFSSEFKGEPIPHFDAVLKWLLENNVQANIEIKPFAGADKQTTEAVINGIHRLWPQDRALPLVSSFSWEALTLCSKMAPELPLGFLLHAWDKHWLQKAKQIACDTIHFNRKILTEARVRSVKQEGYVVCCYTVNTKAQALQLFEWGVDAIFSDYPDLL